MLQSLATREVHIPGLENSLAGELEAPPAPSALVIVADIGGRHSACARHISHALHDVGIATLVLDLNHPDIADITLRLQDAAEWAQAQDAWRNLPLGLIGKGVTGAAALIAAAKLGKAVHALVVVGGQPHMAGPAALAAIKASTLLLLSTDSAESEDLSEQAYQRLNGERSLAIAPAEVGQIAEMAVAWFQAHMMELETA